MTSFMNSARTELNNLIQLRDDLTKDPAPANKMVITTKKQGSKTFFYRTVSSGKTRDRKYLGDFKSPELHKCARSAYKYELLNIINRNIAILYNFIADYMSFDKPTVLSRLSPSIVNVQFDTEFSTIMRKLQRWAREDYKKNTRPFDGKVILAKDGRRVRSKSECVIYNMLLDAGIPFRYDPVIKLKRVNKNGEVEEYFESPDFQIMCPDCSCILIEHAGKLTSMQYAEVLARKLQIYQLNGYLLGYTLFVTSDDVTGGIDTEEIMRIVTLIRARFPYL